MKTLLNFLIALWCMFLTLPLTAQQDTSTLTGWFRWAFEPLEKSVVLSGILIHQTPVFIWPGTYDGIHVHDTLALSRSQWGWLYGQFIAATVDTPYLPNPAIYVQPGMKPHRYGQPVQLMYMATRYDMFRDSALVDTLIYIEDHQWFDVENRPESPYIQDTCYALAALHHDVWGLEMTVVLSDSLLFNNLGWEIDSFEIDAGDGLGWRTAWPDSLIAITYGDEGRKEVILRLIHGADTFLAQTYLQVKEYDIGGRSGEGMPYDVDHPEVEESLDGVELRLFSACTDKKLRRPLIVVEGYPNRTVAEVTMFDQDNGLLSQQGLNEWFNDREYDIIWVDWLDNESSVETQADRLINVIDWVNERKRADGSNEPNIMIGASFGGLVGKYAMLHMHNILERDSEVETYFTYDSPLKGANLPVGIQAFLRDIESQLAAFGGNNIDFQEALQLLDGPAPAQMLLKRVVPAGTSFELDDTPFLALQDDIATLEAIRGMDQICRYITLSNGAGGGHTQDYLEPEQIVIDLEVNLEMNIVLNVNIEVDLLATAFSADDVNDDVYYDRRFIIGVNASPFEIELSRVLSLSEPLGLDNAPGGWTNLGLTDLDEGVLALEDLMLPIENFSFERLDAYCFIPTVSSLDMPLSTDRYTSNPEGGDAVLRWTVSTELTPIPWGINLSDYNQSHVSMDSRIATLLKSEIKPPMVAELEAPMQSGEIFNFGSSDPVGDEPEVTPRSINEDITLADGAEIWINRMDKIGYINSSNPENAAPQSFSVYVPGVSCEEEDVVVTVDDEGKIIIGDVDGATLNTGQLYFLSRSELNVLAGGEVILTDGLENNLVLAGGQMTIEEHGFVDARWGSRILIQDGSTLTVKTGGTLRISHYSALEVEEGGILVVEPGAIIQLWDGHEPGGEARIHLKDGGTLTWQGSPDFSGNGFFQFDAGSTFDAQDDVLITGMGKGFRFMHIGGSINLEGVHVAFEDGLINYGYSGSFSLVNGSLEATDMEFIGGQDAVALDLVAPSSLNITGCYFESLTGITVYEYQGGISDFLVDDCEFEDCYMGIGAWDCSFITANNSNFTDCFFGIYMYEDVNYFYGYNLDIRKLEPSNNGAVGIQLHDNPSCRLHNCTIANYERGIYLIEIMNDENRSNVYLYDSDIINCEFGILVEDGGVGTDRGLVLMDCSNAIDNLFAIKGKDVLLEIDAAAHAPSHPVTGITPNYFSLTSNEEHVFFEVCYKQRNDIQEVFATENRWNGRGVNGLPAYPGDYHIKNNYCGSGPGFVPLIYNPIYQGTPPECPEPPRVTGPPDTAQYATTTDTSIHCVRITTSIPADTFLVHNAYIQGMYWFYWEDFDQSYEKLEPVAAIPDTIRSGMSGRCRHYIDVARVMVDALAPLRSEPDPLIGGPISDGPTSVDTATRLGKQEVYPNPARGTVTIIPAHGTNRIKIVNAQGLEITEIQGVVGERIVSVADWPEGLYMVISQADTGRVIEVTRMVVSR